MKRGGTVRTALLQRLRMVTPHARTMVGARLGREKTRRCPATAGQAPHSSPRAEGSGAPGRRLVEGREGSGLGLGEVTGSAPLGAPVSPCGLRGGPVGAGRRPGA